MNEKEMGVEGWMLDGWRLRREDRNVTDRMDRMQKGWVCRWTDRRYCYRDQNKWFYKALITFK